MNKDRIEILRKKIEAAKAVLAQETVRQQKVKAKLQAREFLAVGAAVCAYASRSPEFKATVSEALPVVTDDKTRQFLVSRGWPL